ncbi:MAG: 2-oxoacid:acceptor oxidoreductase family protein [Magnetococcales bacterium]|nr:2-oxoacid:acceptor oxidoreductase family protein [Magnetococcales bacterium]MBF0321801.1 2-oxoacid:acceptor oxidoreductase family protein [Magnetococcales bacterium]
MFQIRIHGRGGQGVVSAAEMLSVAAFLEGRHAQAFPSFGSERMGAPVISYCRIDDKEIRLREPIMKPDAIIIQDPTLLLSVDVFSGCSSDGYILINSGKSYDELGIADFVSKFPAKNIGKVDATELAIKYVGRPVPNASLLGIFAAVTGQIKLDSVIAAVREKFPGAVGEANIVAARAAYDRAVANMGGGA